MFEALKSLLLSDGWPEAAPSHQIVNSSSEEDRLDRAEGIVDFLSLKIDIQNKNILDFGCGEGHVTKFLSKKLSLPVVGYDIEKQGVLEWNQPSAGFLLTTDFEAVKEKSPYDVIILHDVIDHVKDPVECLNSVGSLLSTNGLIYMRCHPWCSRHGGHLYKQINKAFVHLIFSDEELVSMGYKLESVNKIVYPKLTYEDYIKKADLKICSMEIERDEPESFFKSELLLERIKKVFPEKLTFPNVQLRQSFLEFVLKK